MSNEFQVLKWKQFPDEWPERDRPHLIRSKYRGILMGNPEMNVGPCKEDMEYNQSNQGYIYSDDSYKPVDPGEDNQDWQWAYLDEDNTAEFNTSQGPVLMQLLRRRIDEARMQIEDSEEELRAAEDPLGRLKTMIESFVNAYEEACVHYLNGHLDEQLFKDDLGEEIPSLFKSKNTSEKIFQKETTYLALAEVHDRWFGTEYLKMKRKPTGEMS